MYRTVFYALLHFTEMVELQKLQCKDRSDRSDHVLSTCIWTDKNKIDSDQDCIGS